MLSHQDTDFVNEVQIDDIPWNRLVTAYGSATEFPDIFVNIAEGDVKLIDTLAEQIEHQSTLWQATPFALIFMTRLFNTNDDEELLSEMLELFGAILEACKDQFDNFELADPLPSIESMLDDEYLLPEEDGEMDYDDFDDEDEEDDDASYEESFSDEQFSSFYIYSFEIIATCKEKFLSLSRSEDTDIATAAQAVLDMIDGINIK